MLLMNSKLLPISMRDAKSSTPMIYTSSNNHPTGNNRFYSSFWTAVHNT